MLLEYKSKTDSFALAFITDKAMAAELVVAAIERIEQEAKRRARRAKKSGKTTAEAKEAEKRAAARKEAEEWREAAAATTTARVLIKARGPQGQKKFGLARSKALVVDLITRNYALAASGIALVMPQLQGRRSSWKATTSRQARSPPPEGAARRRGGSALTLGVSGGETPGLTPSHRLEATLIEDRIERLARRDVEAARLEPEGVICEALGPYPQAEPKRARLWQEAAHQIASYRRTYGLREEADLIGVRPQDSDQRAEWIKATRSVERARHVLARSGFTGTAVASVFTHDRALGQFLNPNVSDSGVTRLYMKSSKILNKAGSSCYTQLPILA